MVRTGTPVLDRPPPASVAAVGPNAYPPPSYRSASSLGDGLESRTAPVCELFLDRRLHIASSRPAPRATPLLVCRHGSNRRLPIRSRVPVCVAPRGEVPSRGRHARGAWRNRDTLEPYKIVPSPKSIGPSLLSHQLKQPCGFVAAPRGVWAANPSKARAPRRLCTNEPTLATTSGALYVPAGGSFTIHRSKL